MSALGQKRTHPRLPRDVRFTPVSGHPGREPRCLLCATKDGAIPEGGNAHWLEAAKKCNGGAMDAPTRSSSQSGKPRQDYGRQGGMSVAGETGQLRNSCTWILANSRRSPLRV